MSVHDAELQRLTHAVWLFSGYRIPNYCFATSLIYPGQNKEIFKLVVKLNTFLVGKDLMTQGSHLAGERKTFSPMLRETHPSATV